MGGGVWVRTPGTLNLNAANERIILMHGFSREGAMERRREGAKARRIPFFR